VFARNIAELGAALLHEGISHQPHFGYAYCRNLLRGRRGPRILVCVRRRNCDRHFHNDARAISLSLCKTTSVGADLPFRAKLVTCFNVA
jgi:hypothetical protein